MLVFSMSIDWLANDDINRPYYSLDVDNWVSLPPACLKRSKVVNSCFLQLMGFYMSSRRVVLVVMPKIVLSGVRILMRIRPKTLILSHVVVS